MAARRSDFWIRNEKDRLMKRLNNIFKINSKLDDPSWALKTTKNEIKKAINKYRDQLSIVETFMRSDSIQKVGIGAMEDFADALSSFVEFEKMRIGTGNVEEMVRVIQSEYADAMAGVFNIVASDTTQKILRFNLMADAEQIPNAILKQMLDQRGIVKIGGKNYQGKTLEELWGVLTKRYGSYDTITFEPKILADGTVKPGKRMPLNTYVDGKITSMSTDIHNTTNAMEAARRGIETMKISSHGSPDSCNIWEGAIVFTSQAAKDIFIKENPEIQQARSWPTLPDLRNNSIDKSHIFKFNCRHTALPYPVKYLDPQDIKKIGKGPKIQKTYKEARLDAEKINVSRGKTKEGKVA